MKTVTLDCATFTTKQQLHAALKEALSFPDWYGNNLDALYDCLTEVDTPTCLQLTNWNHDLPIAPGFEDTFRDAAEANSCFQVMFFRDK